jgi:hypothetical protein
VRPYPEKIYHKNRASGMAQSECPEFKTPKQQKKKKKKFGSFL